MNLYQLLVIVAVSTMLPACAPHRIDESAAKEPPRHCLKETGTRIERKDAGCIPAAGRSYTREDLQRTGQPQTGDALKRISPP